MRRVKARERLDGMTAEKRVRAGLSVSSTHPAITPAACATGLNFAIIDRKHGPNDTVITAGHNRAAGAYGQQEIGKFERMTYRSQHRTKQVANLVVAE